MIKDIQMLSGEPCLSDDKFASLKERVGTAMTVSLVNNDDAALRMVLNELVKEVYAFGYDEGYTA